MSPTLWRIVATVAVVTSLLGAGTACSSSEPGPAPTSTWSGSAVGRPASVFAGEGGANPAIAAPRFAGDSVPSAQEPAAAPAGGIRAVHSPNAVAIDERFNPGQCHAAVINAASGDFLPDASCTPGGVDPAVTEATIGATICRSGYTATVRPAASATDRFKVASLAAYGEVKDHTIELDHLVSLEIGGANSASNLWPEMNRAGATGTTNPKDAVENALHAAVCDHEVTLEAAQDAIAGDWVTALQTLGL